MAELKPLTISRHTKDFSLEFLKRYSPKNTVKRRRAAWLAPWAGFARLGWADQKKRNAWQKMVCNSGGIGYSRVSLAGRFSVSAV